MKGRANTNLYERNVSVCLSSSLSARSTHLRTSHSCRVSRQTSSSPTRALTSPALTIQERQRKISTDLLKLELDNESSEEELNPTIEVLDVSSGRLKNIISSKFGIGGAKNKHAAAMNALLRLRPKNADRKTSNEELKKMSFDWMKTFINRVWTIYKFSKIMRLYSGSLLERSARMEAEDVVRSGEYESKQSSKNNPSLPLKFRSLLPPKYIKILYKFPDSRSDSDISELRVFLRSSINEFRQYTESTQIYLCKSMFYAGYEKGRVILRQGHPGKNFYIVLSGSLIWMRSDIDKESGEVYSSDNVMKTGEIFGAIALIRGSKRTDTIVCCEDSELLMIDESLFDKFCPNLFQEQWKEKMKAVRGVNLFRDWDESDLEEVVLETRLQEFPINKVVVRDSMECPVFFLVVEGKCKVLKEITVAEMENRPKCVIQNSSRHSHLTELPPSKYCRSQHSQNKDKQTQLNSLVEGIITRDGKAYLQLRELLPGDIFELTEMYNSHIAKTGTRSAKQELNYTHSLMLVSCGARLLEITKSKFKSKAGSHFLDSLHKYFIKYPGEDELVRNYRQHIAWIIYKREMVTREMKFQRAKGVTRTFNNRTVFSQV